MRSSDTPLQTRTFLEWLALLFAVLGVLVASVPAHAVDADAFGQEHASAFEESLAAGWALDPTEVKDADAAEDADEASDAIRAVRTRVPMRMPGSAALPAVPALIGVHVPRRIEGARWARGPPAR